MSVNPPLKPIRDTHLAISTAGHTSPGIPLVWGHNLMGSRQVDTEVGMFDWSELSKHFPVIRYDARGHGESQPCSSDALFHWSNLARDMIEVAEFQGKGPYILGGASMGCATALEAAMQQPENVAGLVLVLPPTAWHTRPNQSKLYRRMARMIGLTGMMAFKLASFLPRTESNNCQKRLSNSTARHLADGDKRSMIAALRGAANSDFPPMLELQQLDIPVAIFAWPDDFAHPLATANLLRQMLPNVQVFDVSEGDNIDHWNQLLIDFVRAQEMQKAA